MKRIDGDETYRGRHFEATGLAVTAAGDNHDLVTNILSCVRRALLSLWTWKRQGGPHGGYASRLTCSRLQGAPPGLRRCGEEEKDHDDWRDGIVNPRGG